MHSFSHSSSAKTQRGATTTIRKKKARVPFLKKKNQPNRLIALYINFVCSTFVVLYLHKTFYFVGAGRMQSECVCVHRSRVCHREVTYLLSFVLLRTQCSVHHVGRKEKKTGEETPRTKQQRRNKKKKGLLLSAEGCTVVGEKQKLKKKQTKKQASKPPPPPPPHADLTPEARRSR